MAEDDPFYDPLLTAAERAAEERDRIRRNNTARRMQEEAQRQAQADIDNAMVKRRQNSSDNDGDLDMDHPKGTNGTSWRERIEEEKREKERAKQEKDDRREQESIILQESQIAAETAQLAATQHMQTARNAIGDEPKSQTFAAYVAEQIHELQHTHEELHTLEDFYNPEHSAHEEHPPHVEPTWTQHVDHSREPHPDMDIEY